MKIIIVDDDYLQIELLKEMLFNHPDINDILGISDAVASVQLIEDTKPDIVFMDVNMPEMTGIDVARKINQLGLFPVIIFTTSFENFAVEAFDLNAGDYLVKPYSKERLFKAVDKARIRINQKKAKNTEIKKIAVYEGDAIILVDVEDIFYIESALKRTYIYTKNRKYEIKETLAVLEKKLEDDFIRCHKSYLVNYKKINRIEPMFNRTYVIKFENKSYKVYVSRKYAKEVLSLLGI